MNRTKPFTSSHEDLIQDNIFISGDAYEQEQLELYEIMMEYMEGRKAKINVKEEEFAEYEVVSSQLNEP